MRSRHVLALLIPGISLSLGSFVLYCVQPTSAAPVVVTAQNPAPNHEEVSIRKSIEAFTKAANDRDAKAAAALWTEGGEFTDDEGVEVRGRADLEKMYVESFAATPKGKFDATLDSIRLLGKNIATSEGTITFTPADGSPAAVTKFSAMHVRDEQSWLVATVREWMPDNESQGALSDLEYLIGEWEAKRDDRELRIAYAWGDGKAYIQAKYSLKDKAEVAASGIEIIALDPATGELRTWLFDKSGTIGESVWTRDGKRWVNVAGSTLPLGVEASATHVVVPLDKDTFTWQTVDRVVEGQPLPNVAPLKVTRVKK